MPTGYGHITAFQSELRDFAAEFFEGSREWLDKLVEDFLADNTRHHLVIIGEPGVGKSTYAAHLASRYQCPRYFTRAKEELEVSVAGADPKAFLVSIGDQLGQKYGPAIFGEGLVIRGEVRIGTAKDQVAAAGVEVEEVHISHFRRLMIEGLVEAEELAGDARVAGVRIKRLYDSTANMDAQTLLQEALIDPLAKIAEVYPNETVLMVIDGLDVSLRQSGSRLVDLIPTLDNLRAVMTSRPGDHLARFHSEDKIALSETEDIRRNDGYKNYVSQNQADSRSYIRHIVSNDSVIAPAIQANRVDVSPEQFIQTLAVRSEGNFLYLHHFFGALRQDIRLGRAGFLKLESVPRGLYDFYRAILIERIKRDVSDERWVELYVPVLGILAVAQEALTQPLIAKFADLELPQVSSVLGRIRPFLVEFPGKQESAYRIYHLSFAEYLLDTSKNRDYPLDGPIYHYQIALCYRRRRTSDGWALLDWSNWNSIHDVYIFKYLAHHLFEAQKILELRTVLLNFNWLDAKLRVTDVNNLIADFYYLRDHHDLKVLQSAIKLSAFALSQDSRQLAPQLIGRLMHSALPSIQLLLAEARRLMTGSWLRPLTTSLTQPTGPLLLTLSGHSKEIDDITITPDDQQVISASWDGTLKVWDLTSGTQVRSLPHSDFVSCVAVTPDGLQVISGSHDRKLKVWDLTSGEELRTLNGHTDWVTDVAVTADGQYAVSASEDRTLKVWDLTSGETKSTLAGHLAPVLSVAITPDDQQVISASWDETLKVWDLTSGTQVRTLVGHSGPVTDVALTRDGGHVISASLDGTLRVWDLSAGMEVRTLEGDGHPIYGIAITPDDQQVISASWDETLKVWDLTSGTQVRTLVGHSSLAVTVAITSDGRYAISGSQDKTLKVWDLTSGEVTSNPMGHVGWVTDVAASVEKGYVVSASRDGTLKLWNLETGQEIVTLPRHTDGVNGVAVMPGGRYVLSACDDHTLRLWDVTTGEEIRTFSGHSEYVNAVAVTRDGHYAISASADETLRVWNVASGEQICTLVGHTAQVRDVVVVPGDQYVVSASWDKTVKVWDLTSGTQVRSLPHSDFVSCVAVTPDGLQVISGSHDRKLKVWDLTSGEELRTLNGHTDWVTDVAVTADGQYAVSTSWDGMLKVWHLGSGLLDAQYTADFHINCCCVLGGIEVVAGDKSGALHFLRVEGH